MSSDVAGGEAAAAEALAEYLAGRKAEATLVSPFGRFAAANASGVSCTRYQSLCNVSAASSCGQTTWWRENDTPNVLRLGSLCVLTPVRVSQ